MRARDLVWLFLIGCGDNLGAPDAAGRIDAAIDAPDAPIDGPLSTAMSRVWSVGDILADNVTIAGAFTHGTGTPPFGPGNEPPIRIANVRAFDARGGKIAYVSDATMAGRFDLHVAGADNTNPIVVVQGGTPNVEINAVALSPDGTKVAFTMDSLLLNNGFDLYVAPATAGAAAMKVSPNRPLLSPAPAEQDVFAVFTWSADSKYLAFSADLTDNNFDQAYVVDTSVASPTTTELLGRADIATQATGAQGVRGALLFDDQNNVYFRARVQTGNTQFQLFRATPAGARTVFALPARGDSSTPDAGAFAITPDGTKIVFSADAPTVGAYDLYLASLAAPTPAKLTSLAGPGNANFTAAMAISPDATKIALVADFLGGDGNDEPYVVHLDGSTQAPRRLISLAATCPGCTSVDAIAVQWTADAGSLYVLGDIATSNDTRVFRVDPAAADQAPVLTVTTPANGDVSDLLVRPIP